MSWIEEVSYQESTGRLRTLYDRIKGPGDSIDNVMSIHSLRPSSLVGHMTLYKNVLHHTELHLEKWFIEYIGVYVSELNKCLYCVTHHKEGLRKLLNEMEHGAKLFEDLFDLERCENALGPKKIAAKRYSKILTLSPSNVTESNIQSLRAEGWADGEILEINQIVAYFSYANRTVLGLGVDLDGDIIGLSPSDSSDESNWGHR